MKSIKSLIIYVALLIIYTPTILLSEQLQIQPPKTYEEWSKENRIDDEGKLKIDKISRLPEISTLYGYGRGGTIKLALGIELFHKRDRPRRHKWKLELQLAEDEVALGVSRILVPVANVTVGPYFGLDVKNDKKTYGVRFGIFKF
jgi:hypothetical protein